MRKLIHPSHSNDNNPDHLLNGTLLWKNKDFLLPDHPSLSSSPSYEISECTFTNLDSQATGGAISLDNSDSFLSVDRSTFTGCNVGLNTDGHFGGAIHYVSSSSISISSSSFVSCKSSKGGGVSLWPVSHFCSVDDCLFTNCEAKHWGNGLLLFGLPQINGGTSTNNIRPPPACSRCRFLHNENRPSTSGAMYFVPYSGEHSGRDNLYVSNKANFYAGAVEFNLVGDYPVPSPVFYFNFFSDNDGKGKGDDVIIFNNNKYDNNLIPFSHCFTSTQSLTRLTHSGEKNPDVSNWLPHECN